jgi:hypothetical protein
MILGEAVMEKMGMRRVVKRSQPYMAVGSDAQTPRFEQGRHALWKIRVNNTS